MTIHDQINNDLMLNALKKMHQVIEDTMDLSPNAGLGAAAVMIRDAMTLLILALGQAKAEKAFCAAHSKAISDSNEALNRMELSGGEKQ